VFFGGIGARGQFGWDFSDPGLTDPACPNPKLEFTYTVDPDVSMPTATATTTESGPRCRVR
jgi:hypothetical protein